MDRSYLQLQIALLEEIQRLLLELREDALRAEQPDCPESERRRLRREVLHLRQRIDELTALVDKRPLS